jgi:DNA-binding MarR family transcriptional regulator
MTITALAAAAALDRSTMGRNLNPLLHRRLVKISSSEDQREHLVRLTREGRAAIKRALPRWTAVQTQVQSVVKVDAIHRLIERIESANAN